MTEERRHGVPHWGRRDWREGQPRPPWWPANETFPPQDWPRTRRRFMRRVAFFSFLAFLAFTFFVAIFVWLLIQVFSPTNASGAPAIVFVLLGFFVLVLGFNMGRSGVRRYVAPLGDLEDAAERIEAGDYTVRVNARGPRSLRKFANAFNAMSARLERSETERRRLLADVTHELRTPLTVIQGNIEALIDGVRPTDDAHLRAILDDTHVMSRLVDDLRTLSIAEAGALPLHREQIDLGVLARATVISLDAQARSAGVTMRVDIEGDATAELDPVRIREVITNIVANALRYTPRGGSVTVEVRASERSVSVVVRDTGAGIAPDLLPQIFERFSHAPDSPGAGLGLAIAKGIVAAHGGQITAASEPGLGTELRFTVPRGPTAT